MRDRKDIIEYTKKIFNNNVNLNLINNQIDNLLDFKHYTCDGIVYTLYYICEIKEMELNANYGIKLVETYYNEAKEYKNKIDKINEKNKQKDFIKQNKKYVTIDAPNIKKYKSRNDIEIENFLKGDE